jgi:hypothetical protein
MWLAKVWEREVKVDGKRMEGVGLLGDGREVEREKGTIRTAVRRYPRSIYLINFGVISLFGFFGSKKQKRMDLHRSTRVFPSPTLRSCVLHRPLPWTCIGRPR